GAQEPLTATLRRTRVNDAGRAAAAVGKATDGRTPRRSKPQAPKVGAGGTARAGGNRALNMTGGKLRANVTVRGAPLTERKRSRRTLIKNETSKPPPGGASL
ncbi:MAG: hypothetical protein Q8N96_14330, partial [Methylovulum sp.]|nr:hypothetical protein [Methylovulum sp.]